MRKERESAVPDPLHKLTDAAIQRAEQLAARGSRDELGAFPNPSTKVHELVQHLLALPSPR